MLRTSSNDPPDFATLEDKPPIAIADIPRRILGSELHEGPCIAVARVDSKESAMDEGGSCVRILSKKVWAGCLVLGFLVAVLHLTSLQTSSVAMFRSGFGRTEVTPLEAVTKDLKNEMQNPAPVNPTRRKKDTEKESNVVHQRVAICLVGGARAFELTGHSIKKYVLDAYNKSDVFLHAPFDRDAHKLTLLNDAPNLAMARIFENDHVPETRAAQEVLTSANSPNGIQGLLQYFRLVEGCLTMIHKYETKHKFKYDWIVRTRVDGYWSGPLPPLKKLHPNYYHVPYGCRYGGLNDRLGIGTRKTSWVALSRLSLIPKLHEHGYRALNSEAAFKHQLDVSHVRAKFDDFSFCILTSRKYAWPLERWGVPVASIRSTGSLNGAKCKPCHAVVSGDAARQALSVLDSGWGWIHPVSNLQLCDARHDLQPGWQSMFDEISGPELAHVRQSIANRTEEQCVDEVRRFGKLWEDWDAPAPETVCASLHHEPPAPIVADINVTEVT